MTSAPANPVLDRVRAGLSWPDWADWREPGPAETPSTATSPIDHESRSAAVRRRLDLATDVGAGGPYVEIFRNDVLERLDRERGTELGPLASFTFAIKDLVAVAGHRTTAGSAVRADAAVEAQSAPIVTWLESLGAVALGTVTLHEFAFGVTGVNPFLGTAPNPAAPGHITGGSSSGSASAVADGSARISIGTDTGGSIRGPASFCGIVGFKPAFATYPSSGVFPLSGTLDHVGFFATNVADVAKTHHALGHPLVAPRLPERVGVARSDIEAADPAVQDLVVDALARLEAAGCTLVDVPMPDAEKAFVTSTAIMFSEAAAIHARARSEFSERYGADIAARLDLGAALTSIEVATAHEYRRQLISEVRETLADVGCIVGPTTPMQAPLLDDAADPGLPPRIVANTRLGNVVGLPAISLPLPSDEAPVGLQVTAGDNGGLLSMSAAMEPLLQRVD